MNHSPIRISHHAVTQYRNRVVQCCERERSDKALRKVIAAQIRDNQWKLAGGETFAVECGPLIPKAKKFWEMKLAAVTHTFLIECQVVVTTLGYGMRTSRKTNRLKRISRLMQRAHDAARTSPQQSVHGGRA